MTKSNLPLIDLFSGNSAFRHLEYMESLGPRIPGSEAHKRLESYIEDFGSRTTAKYYRQEYSFLFLGNNICFTNIIYVFEGIGINKKKMLFGTHYDSRVRADREKDENGRNNPIPGINDGGSGTSVFIELLKIFNDNPPYDDIALVFFDAEDVGNIDGHDFSEGAEFFARDFQEFEPDEVIVIDMIGGVDACYQVDYEAYCNNSRTLLAEIWQTGFMLGLKPFVSNKNFEGSYFICDHTPFVKRAIPAMLLIDINYEWWHTLDDRSVHCSAESLEAAAKVLLHHVYYSGVST